MRSQSHPDQEYSIDTALGTCSCKRGENGGPCKHQAAVVKYYHVSSLNFVPVDDQEMRHMLYKIATGKALLKADCTDMCIMQMLCLCPGVGGLGGGHSQV